MGTIIGRRFGWFGSLLALAMLCTLRSCAGDETKKDQAGSAQAKTAQTVSYDKQIRPILQAHCQGCHQPAKAGGGYVMTSFDRMLKGGESDEPAIVPAKPDESQLVEMITPHDGKAEMPQDKPPLAAGEIELITRWIAQGAKDDTPQNAATRYDMDHPPQYTRLPVIPALAFSPDGSLLAVAGFHEVCCGNPTARSRPAAWWDCPSGSSRCRSRPTARGWRSPAACPRGWAKCRCGTSPTQAGAVRAGHF